MKTFKTVMLAVLVVLSSVINAQIKNKKNRNS
jgi:regulatory protein YycH of two-component signal transduction system YycFG